MKREICNNQILRHSLSIVCLKTSRAFLFRHSIYRIDRIGGIGVRQLGIGIGIGNIFTLATFTSVWVFECLGV